MRLQVFLSHNGICSRREAMSIVKSGKVKVNGKVVREPSFGVDAQQDSIVFEGKRIKVKQYDYLMLNKPKGYVTTRSDRHAMRTVFDLIPKQWHHLVPVGRLDKETEGLLLLTNDGDITYKLTHPKFKLDKKYFVRVKGVIEQDALKRLQHGMYIMGKKTSRAQVTSIKRFKDASEFVMTIHEGQKRQIRLMCHKVGHKVGYLKRIEQGPLKLLRLKTGAWRLLTKTEKQALEKL